MALAPSPPTPHPPPPQTLFSPPLFSHSAAWSLNSGERYQQRCARVSDLSPCSSSLLLHQAAGAGGLEPWLLTSMEWPAAVVDAPQPGGQQQRQAGGRGGGLGRAGLEDSAWLAEQAVEGGEEGGGEEDPRAVSDPGHRHPEQQQQQQHSQKQAQSGQQEQPGQRQQQQRGGGGGAAGDGQGSGARLGEQLARRAAHVAQAKQQTATKAVPKAHLAQGAARGGGREEEADLEGRLAAGGQRQQPRRKQQEQQGGDAAAQGEGRQEGVEEGQEEEAVRQGWKVEAADGGDVIALQRRPQVDAEALERQKQGRWHQYAGGATTASSGGTQTPSAKLGGMASGGGHAGAGGAGQGGRAIPLR